MTNPLNKELQESRSLLEHYKRVLKTDKELKLNGNPNNHKLLAEEDIDKINLKIEGLSKNISMLLDNDNEYNLS